MEAKADIWQLRLPEKHNSSWNQLHHRGTQRFYNWRQQGRWPRKTQYHAVYRNVNFAGNQMDSVLIKTNFSKKVAAFLICLCHWRHLEFIERSRAALSCHSLLWLCELPPTSISNTFILSCSWLSFGIKHEVALVFFFESFLNGSEQRWMFPHWGHLKNQDKYAVEQALVFWELVLSRSLCCERIIAPILLRKEIQFPATNRVSTYHFQNSNTKGRC